MNYVSYLTSIVQNNAKYLSNGSRRNCIYLRKNICDIFEKLPDNTPDNVYKVLLKLSENPKCTIYTAEKELNKLMSGTQKAKNALAELYEQVIAKAKIDGNNRRATIFEQCKNNINSLDSKETYAQLLEALYKDLRTAEYGMSNIKNINIDKITARENSLMKVKIQNGWHYRIPRTRNKNNTVDRISINAIADESLIKDLDNLLGTGKVRGYYKTPDLTPNWLERHDPVTIYLDEKATPEILEKVKNTCRKYIRSTENVLLGEKFAPGLALQKSPTSNDIEALLTQMRNVDTTLEHTIKKMFTDTKTGQLKTSAGYMEAANKLLAIIQQ